METFLANVGKAFIFKGDNFVGAADVLTESTFSFSASPNEVRGGKSNPLLGRWFSDSSLNVTLNNATFKLEYLAWTLGATIEQGGTSVYESTGSGEKITTAGQIELTKTPAAFNGSMLGWYKKPGESGWSVGSINSVGGKYYMSIPNALVDEIYCIKYFYMDENARMMPIPADFNPEELHVVLVNDLYNADINNAGSASVIGRLITDIPRLGLDPSQDLTLNATSSAPVQLTGTAFRYVSGTGCENEATYGSMTEQIFNNKWQDNVSVIAVENAEMTLEQATTETAIVRVIYSGDMPSQRKDNSNFTFATVSGDATTDKNGVVTAGNQASIISVTLTGYSNVEPAYIYVSNE